MWKLDPVKNWFPIHLYFAKIYYVMELGISWEVDKGVCGEERAGEDWEVSLDFRSLGWYPFNITHILLWEKMMPRGLAMGLKQAHFSRSTKPNVISLYIISYVCAFNKPTLTKNK